MPLGEHLRADDEIDFAVVYGLEDGIGGAATPGHIAVQPGDAGRREGLTQNFLNALSAAPEWL